jgi:dGTPase
VILRVIDWEEVPTGITDVLGSGNDEIVNTLVTDLIENSYGKNYLALSEQVFTAMKKLKDFNEQRIYSNPDINTQFSKMQNMYNQIYKRYYLDLKEGNSGSYISEFTGDMESVYRENNDDKRVVIDCLAGMTDDFFRHQYQELFVPQTYI